MVGYEERQKLIEQYRHEPAYRASTMARCAACLGVVSLIAWIGANDPAASVNSVALRNSASIQHASAVYRERVAQFKGTKPTGATLVAMASAGAQPMPVATTRLAGTDDALYAYDPLDLRDPDRAAMPSASRSGDDTLWMHGSD